jgi:hypothetical protein
MYGIHMWQVKTQKYCKMPVMFLGISAAFLVIRRHLESNKNFSFMKYSKIQFQPSFSAILKIAAILKNGVTI